MSSSQRETSAKSLRFSLVIPAYNEAVFLPMLLDSVDVARTHYSGGREAIEVIVGNNMSTDTTAEIALTHGCIVTLIEKRMIAAARNGGAKLATGEIICFIDADSRIHPDTFNAIDRTLSAGDVVVGTTGINPESWSLGIALTWMIATVSVPRCLRTSGRWTVWSITPDVRSVVRSRCPMTASMISSEPCSSIISAHCV
jgi:glycosyltransferase involved in cell wall biosynthesis